MAFLLLMLLPVLVTARIEIDVFGKFGDDLNMAVHYTGSEVDIISDRERLTFRLNDKVLKDGIRKYFGREPNNTFLRSPTPWGDLYQSYGWTQVLRTLIPKSGRILKITTEPQIVMQQVFENNSSKSALFDVGISQKVKNTAKSVWMKGGDLTVGQEIKYEFDIQVFNIGGSSSLTYSSSWGENTEKSQSVTVGSSSELEMSLLPGQRVISKLEATRGSMEIEIEYEASLSGYVAANYDDTFKGHHFWGLDIQAIMAAKKLGKVTSRQVIDYCFYSNSKVVVYDGNVKNKLMEVVF